MDELVIAVSVIGTIVLAIILVILFACRYNSRAFRRFREPMETNGTVEDIRRRESTYSADYTSEPYIITYSYFDGYGNRHNKSFLLRRRLSTINMKTGDRMIVHYDRQNPDDAVTEFQLNVEKSLWWKSLLVLAAIILLAVIIDMYVM